MWSDHEIPEHITENENFHSNAFRPSVHRQVSPRSAYCQEREVSRRDLADEIAQRVLEQRDGAAERLRVAEERLRFAEQTISHLKSSVNDAMLLADKYREQREEASAAAARAERVAHDAVVESEELAEEITVARHMLDDASITNAHLARRCRQLEQWRQVASEVLDQQANAPPPPPPSSEADARFGLTRTKEAIQKAVAEAAALPADERRRKLKQLKAKWHPDKHEVLKEMAEEVSKLINSCIDAIGGEDGAPSAAEHAPTSDAKPA